MHIWMMPIPGTVVILVADKHRQNDNNTSTGKDADVGILEQFAVNFFTFCGRRIQKTILTSAQSTARMEICTAGRMPKSGMCSMENPLVGNTKQVSNSVCDKRTDHTWNKGGIVHDADTYNFHWKDGSSHRGTKESGKRSTHAAHDHDMFIFIVKTEEFSDCVSDTATHLQGGTFTAGRSRKQDA